MSEFSLILPEGGRSAVRKSEPLAAFREAQAANRSRGARGLPMVRLLHRPTGTTWDVSPDADVLAMEAAWSNR